MDHAEDDDFDGDIFIYRGGRAPQHITHARIDKSVDEIEDDGFRNCQNLLTVDTHDGIRKVGKRAFRYCFSLKRINLKSAIEIEEFAFDRCGKLECVEFGDKLEIILKGAFFCCTSLNHLKLPSIITIRVDAFYNCQALNDIELSERLETIGRQAFANCYCLQRIAIPMKRDMFEFDDSYEKHTQFDGCEQLTTVDLVGAIHETVASLHMESWRSEMTSEIDRINQVLPTKAEYGKTNAIRQCMELLLDKLDHYKAEHCRYVKEGITFLELALWKAKLCEKEDNFEEGKTKKAKVDAESARKERRITCGADIVIKNVLLFLQLV